ncbi:MAG: hypothetical protein LUH53_07075, partial [Lachnospiraceae bacterium]|nr:hypothetical protein [Lachnospiraceae bacterium]
QTAFFEGYMPLARHMSEALWASTLPLRSVLNACHWHAAPAHPKMKIQPLADKSAQSVFTSCCCSELVRKICKFCKKIIEIGRKKAYNEKTDTAVSDGKRKNEVTVKALNSYKMGSVRIQTLYYKG